MTNSKADDMRAKTADELKSQLLQLKKQAFNLRFQAATGQLQNPAEIRHIRRDIARIKTILGEKARHAAATTTSHGAGHDKGSVL